MASQRVMIRLPTESRQSDAALAASLIKKKPIVVQAILVGYAPMDQMVEIQFTPDYLNFQQHKLPVVGHLCDSDAYAHVRGKIMIFFENSRLNGKFEGYFLTETRTKDRDSYGNLCVELFFESLAH